MDIKASIEYKKNTSSFDAVLVHLLHVDRTYYIPLSERVNLREYSQKIIDKAIRQEAWLNGILVGLVAYYINLTQDALFVTNVSVSPEIRGLGVASKLMQILQEDASCLHMSKIDLVADSSVVGFYMKNGYSIIGKEQDDTYYMSHRLQ